MADHSLLAWTLLSVGLYNYFFNDSASSLALAPRDVDRRPHQAGADPPPLLRRRR